MLIKSIKIYHMKKPLVIFITPNGLMVIEDIIAN